MSNLVSHKVLNAIIRNYFWWHHSRKRNYRPFSPALIPLIVVSEKHICKQSRTRLSAATAERKHIENHELTHMLVDSEPFFFCVYLRPQQEESSEMFQFFFFSGGAVSSVRKQATCEQVLRLANLWALKHDKEYFCVSFPVIATTTL